MKLKVKQKEEQKEKDINQQKYQKLRNFSQDIKFFTLMSFVS